MGRNKLDLHSEYTCFLATMNSKDYRLKYEGQFFKCIFLPLNQSPYNMKYTFQLYGSKFYSDRQ